MKDEDQLTRRSAMIQAFGFGAAALIPASFLAGCGSKLYCNDVTSLSQEDLKNRSDNAYVEAATDPKKTCTGCAQFKPAGEKQCGACLLVKGPINPAGSCKNWTAKT